MAAPSRSALLVLVAVATVTVAAGRTRAQVCVGDCNGDGTVTIGELIKGVNIALSRTPIDACPAFDIDGNGMITVNELIAAVRRALVGCNAGLEPGFAALAGGDLRTAATAFGDALAANPNDNTARFFAAMSQGTARVLDSSEARDLAGRAGITIEGDSGDVCAMHVTFPHDLLASSPRTSEFLDAIRRIVRPEVEHVVAELAALPADAVVNLPGTALPPCVRKRIDIDSLEIDRGDLLAARSGLETGLALLDLVDGYNSDASLHEILDATRQALFTAEPQLLTLQSADKLASAGTHFNNAADLMIQAIDAVRAEMGNPSDDQSNDLLVIEEDDIDNARKARLGLTLFEQALAGEVSLPIDIVTGDVDLMDTGLGAHERLNLSRLFTGQLSSLRTFLPPFDERGNFDAGQFPDPTFGGTAPDLTQMKIDNFLVGGPACAECTNDDDCNPLGVGNFFCGFCFDNCQDFDTRRCSDGFVECTDGTYG